MHSVGPQSLDRPIDTPADGAVGGRADAPLAPAAAPAGAPAAGLGAPHVDFSTFLGRAHVPGDRASSAGALELEDAPDAIGEVDADADDLGADPGAPGPREHLDLPGSALVVVRGDDAVPFSALLGSALFGPPLDETLAARPGLERQLRSAAVDLARRAYPEGRTTARQSDRWIDHEARDEHHRALLAIYQQHMRLPHHGMSENQFHPLACDLLRTLERPWERDILERARRHQPLGEATLPADGAGFAAWYKQAAFTHPLYEHDLYAFVSSEATRAQIEWFLTMEAAGEAAFDDLVALGQVGTRGEVKMEMAQNFWDEMGNGKTHAVHTHLFYRLIEGLDITPPESDVLPWQVLGGVNVMLWACLARRNAFRAQGALGAVELLAPQRCTRIVHGAVRLGIAKRTVSYYGAHAIIDIGHAEGWLAHVVAPQVDSVPESRVGIAEGLLARADASLDYFDYCLAAARAM